MSNPCSTLPGWGSISFGSGPWAGTVYVGTLLPTYPPFDVFCLGPCGSLLTVTMYPEVEVTTGGQWLYDAQSDSLHFWSGETSTQTSPAGIEVRTGLPDQFTVEWSLRFDELPADFSNVATRRMHVGAGSHQGYIAGLMFSQVGIASVPDPNATSATAIPGSSGIIEAGQTYLVKLVVSSTVTYVYITKYADYVLRGHTLRFMLASELASVACPTFLTDMAWVHLTGSYSLGDKVDMRMGEFCLSSKLLITDFPPIADAGPDQAAQFCSIVQLDGTGSVDPEGLGLRYQWRLLDAPVASGFVLDGLLGQTHPLPVPIEYTDKWYCSQLAELTPGDIVPGDILVVAGNPYTISALDTDGLYGDFIQVTAKIIPDALPLQAGKILRQLGISNLGTSKPTFYPDVPGFYKFDLMVFDGGVWSTPSVAVINVVSSAQPRGVVPDMRFIWEYLSDFWKLVDDKGRYTVVWSGLAQFCASELLNLWQYEYNKSLRDVQRTFQRRWLSYNLAYLLPRTISSFRAIYAPYDSSFFHEDSASGVPGTSVTFYTPTEQSITVSFFMPAGSSSMTAADVVSQLTAALPATFTVSIVPDAALVGTVCVRVAASHPFSIIATDSPIFSTAAMVGTLQGNGGAVLWGGTAYKVDRSLSGLGIKENDFLEVDGEMYRIIKLQTSAGGFPNDTVVLKDVVPALASEYWSIPSYFTYAEADFYGQLVSVGDTAVLDVRAAGVGNYIKTTVIAVAVADPTALAVDTSGLDLYLTAPDIYTLQLVSVYRRHYTPISELIVDIPLLQQTLTDSTEETILRRNLDFFIETYRGSKCIKFDERIWVHEEGGDLVPDLYPPVALWAESSYLDNRPTIEANFGLPVGFTLENQAALGTNVDYLSAVRGLWYSYFNGPRVQLLRAGAQILIGLPFAEETGVIEEIRSDYSPNTGRLLVRDALATQIVRSYTYPSSLPLEINPSTGLVYAVGDTVVQFAPLVTGIELVDYVSDKTWIDDYAAGGESAYLQRFFKFLLRVDYGAFNLAAMLFVKEFILKVKPTYTFPIFSVLYNTKDTTIDVTDDVSFYATFDIFDTPTSGHNMARMWDQPEDGYASVTKTPPSGPMGAVWKNSYDCSQTGGGVDWAYDKIQPQEEVMAIMCITFLAPTTPPVDSIFAWDLPVYDPADPGTPISWSYDVDLPAGTYCRDKIL